MEDIKVLIIDDNTSLIDMVKEYFAGSSVCIKYEAYNGLEGINILEDNLDDKTVLTISIFIPELLDDDVFDSYEWVEKYGKEE